jgi:hypothetical protein
MGRKAFFIESKLEVFDYATCDKCGLKIKDVQDGKCFWNPNPKAIDRNICRNCYDVFRHEREERWRRWQEKHAALEHTANMELSNKEPNAEPEPRRACEP